MAQNRKNKKRCKITTASRADSVTDAPPSVSTTTDVPCAMPDAPPAIVEQDHALLLQHHTRFRHRYTFASTSTPPTLILTPTHDLPAAFTDHDLKLLKEAASLLAERKTLPAQDEEIDALLESFGPEDMPDYLLDFYRERQQAAVLAMEAETLLYQAAMKPLTTVLEHAHQQIQGSHAPRQAAANRWYTRHAHAIFHPPTIRNPVDTFGDFETVHISTQLPIVSRKKAAVKAGMAALARVYAETMALWHSPLLFTPTDEQALIERRMEGNTLLLDAVFRSCHGTPAGLVGGETEAMEVLGCFGGLVQEERGGYVGRARGLAEYTRAGNAVGGDGQGGFVIDEGKAMLAVAVAMRYEGDHGVWVGQQRSGCGLMGEKE